MSDIVYKYKHNLYINITNKCPNDCEFCDIPKIGQNLGVNLILEKEPAYDDIVQSLEKRISSDFKEVVFCGGGEPLMRLDLLLKLASFIKSKYKINIRLDTCGYPFSFYSGRDVVEALQYMGIDSVSVSVNSTTKEKYNKICHPAIPDAFQKTLDFVKKCKKSELTTRITFVDYKIDKAKCKELANKLNVDYYIRPYSPL